MFIIAANKIVEVERASKKSRKLYIDCHGEKYIRAEHNVFNSQEDAEKQIEKYHNDRRSREIKEEKEAKLASDAYDSYINENKMYLREDVCMIGMSPCELLRHKKRSWGGSRKGSGRKAAGEPRTERITTNISPTLKQALVQLAEARDTTLGGLVNDILTEAVKWGLSPASFV